MIEYTITTDYRECLKCRELYKIFARHLFGDMKYTKTYCVAKDGEKIVGCMGFIEKEDGLVNFNHLIVHPNYRRKGVGVGIIQHAIDELKKDKNVYLIRNHKSSQIIPEKIFTDNGFERNPLVANNVFELYVGDK